MNVSRSRWGRCPNAQAKLEKGDITWLSPEHYQTHKLHNEGKDVCVTIQCYAYALSDTMHYEYFDYLGKDAIGAKVIGHFLPSADWTWGEFKELILDEYRRLGPLPKKRDATFALAMVVTATVASLVLAFMLYLYH